MKKGDILHERTGKEKVHIRNPWNDKGRLLYLTYTESLKYKQSWSSLHNSEREFWSSVAANYTAKFLSRYFSQ